MLVVSVAGLYWSRRWITAVFSPYFTRPSASQLVTAQPPLSVIPLPAPLTSAPLSSAPPLIGEVPEIIQSPAAGLPTHTAVTQSQPPSAIRLEFEVLESCWVYVNRDGNPVLVKVLKPGDDQSFDATEHFYLILGNAGGVRIKINGKPIRPLGKPGEVVKLLINEQNIQELVEKNTG